MHDNVRPIKDVIEAHKDTPLGKSIDKVAKALARSEIMLPTEGVHESGKPLRLKVSTDNQGRQWVYAYTDESELHAAFPDGSPFVAMQFRDAFTIVEREPKFGGMFINRTDKYTYLIPRDVFDRVKATLAVTLSEDSKAAQ